jgi:hypothetical protein
MQAIFEQFLTDAYNGGKKAASPNTPQSAPEDQLSDRQSRWL